MKTGSASFSTCGRTFGWYHYEQNKEWLLWKDSGLLGGEEVAQRACVWEEAGGEPLGSSAGSCSFPGGGYQGVHL